MTSEHFDHLAQATGSHPNLRRRSESCQADVTGLLVKNIPSSVLQQDLKGGRVAPGVPRFYMEAPDKKHPYVLFGKGVLSGALQKGKLKDSVNLGNRTVHSQAKGRLAGADLPRK